MKIYWDTSALINAFMSLDVRRRLDSNENVTRLHSFGEFFAHITGRGIPYRDKSTGESVVVKLSQKECAQWLREAAKSLSFVELTPDELLDGMDNAQSRSILGRGIYDYWHALAANKAKADVVLTRNAADFKALVHTVEWP